MIIERTSLRCTIRHLGRRGSSKLAALAATALVLLGTAPASSSANDATVFVHSAESGELRNDRLILRGVSGRVTWISNDGRSGVVHVRRLHRRNEVPSRNCVSSNPQFTCQLTGDSWLIRAS